MTDLLAPFLPYIIGAGVFLLSLVGVGLQQRRAGAKAEEAKQAQARLEARTEADKIDDAVAGRSPDANRERLKSWSPKP